jgi:hypothetical protein
VNDLLLASLLGVALLPAPDGSISVGDQMQLLGLASEPLPGPAGPPATIQPLTFGDIGIGAGPGTVYADLLNGDGVQSSEFAIAVWSADGVFRNFKPRLTVAPGAGKSITLTVRKGNATARVDTAMTVTISDASTTGTFTGDLVVSDGDVLSLKIVRNGTTPSTDLYYTLEFKGNTTKQSAYGGYCSGLGGGDANPRYTGAFSMFSWPQGDVLAERQTPCPTSGAITKLNILQRWNFGSFGWTGPVSFHLYKNGVKQDGGGGTVDTGITCTSADNNTVKSKTFTLALVAGDRVAIGADVANASPASFEPGIQFTATSDGQSILAGGQVGMPGSTGTTFVRPTDRNAATQVADDEVDGSVTPFTLKNLYLATSVAPGSGDSWTASLRRNAASPGGTPSVTLSDSEVIEGDLVNTLAITSADRFSLRLVTVGTTAPAVGNWAMLVETAPTEPVDPEYPPPTINPPAGDPQGAIYVARVIHSGGTLVQRGEHLIRNPDTLWGGKIPAGLLKVGDFNLPLVREGYPSASCKVELDDTPDPITGECFWRTLAAAVTLEGAYIEVDRHEAPNGITIGTPWRVFAGRVPKNGHRPIDGFRYEFDIRDTLGTLFSDPRRRVEIPGDPLTLDQFAGMLAEFDGKVAPRLLGVNVEDGEGVTRMIPMGRLNLQAAFGGAALNLEVGVGLICQGAVYDILDGYYNLLGWEAEKAMFAGEERIPSEGNPGYGYVHRTPSAGTTGTAEPSVDNGNAWSTTIGGSTTDGGVTWINAGLFNPTERRRIPNEMYGAAGGLVVPHKPGWAAVTGAAPSNPNVPGEFVIYQGRAYTPVFWDLTHPYSPYVEKGAVILTWDTVGRMTNPLSGTPLTDPVDLYISILLNELLSQSDGITAGPMPMLPGLTGDYAAIDMDTRAAAVAVGNALGGLVGAIPLGATGDPEDGWNRLSTLPKQGRFMIGLNRHGQHIFVRKDNEAQATLTLDEFHDHVKFEQWFSDENRGLGVEFQYGFRYVPLVPGPTPQPGQPSVARGGRALGDWASGLQLLPNTAASAALATSWGRPIVEPIELDLDAVRDANTAQRVAEILRDEGAGPAPAFNGIPMFKIVGPLPRLLMRLGTDGKSLEPGTIVAVTNTEALGPNGYVLKRGLVTKVTPSIESDLATVVGEVLTDPPFEAES